MILRVEDILETEGSVPDGAELVEEDELILRVEDILETEGINDIIALVWGDRVVNPLRGEPVGNIVLEMVDDSKVDNDVFDVLIFNEDIAVDNVFFNSVSRP